MIHMSLRVFDKLTLVTLCYVDVDEYIFIVTHCVTTFLITFIKVLIKTQIHWLIQFRVAQGQNLNQNLEASP
jgi:hypothetical protein